MTFMFSTSHKPSQDGTGWLCKGQDQVLDMGMSCHWLGSVFFYQSVGTMANVHWQMCGLWIQQPNPMNGGSWNQKEMGRLLACMQQHVHDQMVCCFFLVEEMLAVCHLIVHMGLQNIEMDGGSGQSLQEFLLLPDTSMQLYL